MKPFGRQYRHHNYEDNHPPKGYVNWWEIDIINKKTERQDGKKQIMEAVRLDEEHVSKTCST